MKAFLLREFESRVHLATLALAFFLVSFVAARAYTTLYPGHVLIGGGLHIHHFWFGLALLAVGGWLGINYNHKDIDIVAAILYGAGGGLIVDEVGLLLTFGDCSSGLTWFFLIALLAFVSIVILALHYRETIRRELQEFVSSKISLYLGVFLAAVSIAFIAETDSLLITLALVGLAAIAIIVVLAFLIYRTRRKNKRNRSNEAGPTVFKLVQAHLYLSLRFNQPL